MAWESPPGDTPSCSGVEWRATVDEDGHYSFAVDQTFLSFSHLAHSGQRVRINSCIALRLAFSWLR
jgi:hypothetical protein